MPPVCTKEWFIGGQEFALCVPSSHVTEIPLQNRHLDLCFALHRAQIISCGTRSKDHIGSQTQHASNVVENGRNGFGATSSSQATGKSQNPESPRRFSAAVELPWADSPDNHRFLPLQTSVTQLCLRSFRDVIRRQRRCKEVASHAASYRPRLK